MLDEKAHIFEVQYLYKSIDVDAASISRRVSKHYSHRSVIVRTPRDTRCWRAGLSMRSSARTCTARQAINVSA